MPEMPAAVWMTPRSPTIFMVAARIPNLSGGCGAGVFGGSAPVPKLANGVAPTAAIPTAELCRNCLLLVPRPRDFGTNGLLSLALSSKGGEGISPQDMFRYSVFSVLMAGSGEIGRAHV